MQQHLGRRAGAGWGGQGAAAKRGGQRGAGGGERDRNVALARVVEQRGRGGQSGTPHTGDHAAAMRRGQGRRGCWLGWRQREQSQEEGGG